MTTDTPRTDAADLIVPAELEGDEQWIRNGQYVSADFARTLERELEELRRAFRQRVIDEDAIKARLERELAALKAENEGLRSALRGLLDTEQRCDDGDPSLIHARISARRTLEGK